MYQTEYEEGFTTSLPSDAKLAALMQSGFRGHEKDYAPYVDVLGALGVEPGARLLDFGCSWGYGSYQLRRAGFDVEACEISAPRAAYGRDKLGVRIRDVAGLPDESFDIFFSAHVIEHVPSVSQLLELGLRVLRPGGLLVTFTPNFSR